MDNANQSSSRIHPLVATAAGAVILASAVGIAAMTGILPKAHSDDAPSTAQQQSAQVAAASATPAVQPAPVVQAQQPVVQQPAAPVVRRPVHVASRPVHTAPRYEPQPQPQVIVDRDVGTVESITPVTQQGHGTGLGAVGGAAAGGLLGNQFGRGNGRTAATIVGVLAGGLAGNTAEQHLRSETDYQVRVRMADGTTRVMTYQRPPEFGVGQRVRVDDNGIVGAG
ncbi:MULTISPECIES: glycine zipper 2TM domain-containing protein [Paraburkholderia]|uniref:Glycine zipper 2TM domain-containing protein n=1 Tax=Paraburkholderia megapolitana TaxID=420953 RepID=A0A1I3JIJ2_9BURK|nr:MULTISPECIES: glycine zipper 2TM domain-containing protein [Paraburkholderia]MCX4160685.1 glycine zipper 2TM domain-containing protein [Paraburkholderia megapolitana]MDN7156182.1 glycine zipper 2TM domain-containing protein [Paraburkholderia sp. CHISQ3]MDQ6493227.1 glycine zipper 2TM domain-containing protein [Paraburkholderia megapolitana]QDQ86071.1 glycine zipper 2TM domain-containing protein [Paraburkholderia megapolitana]SFI60093.1 Glycine zipper 2TM domain-containing protein [Paraburkh